MYIAMRHICAVPAAIFIAIACSAQTNRTPAASRRAATPQAKSQVKVVAGIVEQGGTVRYLPRVDVRVFPQKYANAERTATATYTSELEQLRQVRDTKYKDITDHRRAELKQAEDRYNEQLKTVLASFRFEPAEGIPGCIDFEPLLQRTNLCSQHSFGQKIQWSNQLRKVLAHPALIGSFDPTSFKADKTPYARSQRLALLAVPLSDYENVPEFQDQIRKAVQKERSQAHLASGVALADEAQRSAVSRFVTEWAGSPGKTKLMTGRPAIEGFGFLTFDFISTLHKELEKSVELALKRNTDPPLLAYIKAKDGINGNYDSQQAAADTEFQAEAKSAEKRRAAALEAAARATPPAASASTTLQGDVVLSLAAGTYAIFAEDTTTDHHYRWSLPITVRGQAQTLELTDANALKATADTVASASAQPSYPKASEMTATQKAEYDLRYGSRLLGSWNRVCSVGGNDSQAESRLRLTDSPLGFGFVVVCSSDSVFNTLRMNDNDIASRVFRDYAAPYLRGLPEDLKGTGGSQAFETVTIEVLASAKSFADEYAAAHYFWLRYAFRLADVESFASQKIDAQQLLDRGHIINDSIGRITVKLTGAN